ncbi:MMPL family transporter [Mycobacteroides abscessus]|uniref:MMPL family transporter n=1 Tax=Mycobacteroides abscessus TaxID=36809 RepID=UPI0009A8EBEE|nr:MMPL family transporter [Mycobacteroides abscessus]MDM2645795.1 MMPL family transporter [Mycobacteroides abscessus]MDM2654763.1 MMPL family transporter [Mycobacteroides abscessus]MDM2665325.1 MMPL family transporter [Mycobacteroides abscessus]MDM2670285.1 MMPL family transporter [Mycobacteroides abscessus]MDM2675362.1 MMPL family transporter [Mycobacteroides abscessus]
MSSFLYRLGRAVARRRRTVLAVWIIALALAGGGATFNTGTNDTFEIPGTQSQDALDYLGRVFPEISGTSVQLVIVVPAPGDVRALATAPTAQMMAEIKNVDQVASVINPFDPNPLGPPPPGTKPRIQSAISADGRAAIITAQLKVALADVHPATRTQLTEIGQRLAGAIGHSATVNIGGPAFSNPVPKLSPTEGIGLLIALIVLLLVFGSLLAAGMPLVTALLGVAISVALIYSATVITAVSSTAPMLAVMLGLAVGIDYALFLISRHRDQLAEGLDVEESIARATATAGSAVIFAGLTVIIALLGLAVAAIPFLTTMGLAAATAVAIAVAVAITLVPALMAFCGQRLRPKPVKSTTNRPPRKGLGQLWVRTATRMPLLTVVVVVAALALCAIPATQLRLSLPDNGTEEPGSQARDTYDVVTEHFGAGYNGPLIVTADIITSTDPVAVMNSIAEEISRMPGVASVPIATPNPKADTGIVQVVPAAAPDSPQTEELATAIRGLRSHFKTVYGADTAVTGITAVGIDVSAQLGGSLLPFGILVVGLSLVLLAMVFRSIWVPIKATAGYLLSVGAAFGATSLVFQQGHLADLLHVTHTGSVVSFLPIILMGVLFGLAMDYEVFLVSRIREHYVHHGDPHQAIESGFVSASRVVIAAAIIMFGVFAAFVPEGSAVIKPIAFSLAVGVFVDAFLVRMTLVPAVLTLLGRRAWNLPGWIDRRLPIFDAEGDALMHELRLADWPEPDSTDVIAADALTRADDRGKTVFRGVNLRLGRGQLLVLHGNGPVGKSALLYTIAGRVRRIDGDLKVLGHVLPQHITRVRQKVAVIPCRDTPDPAAAVASALASDIELILIDDIDTVIRSTTRDQLRQHITHRLTPSGRSVSYVITCQDPALIADLLPSGTAVSTHALTPQTAEVTR